MLVVGLTGGIGCGKSTVADLFSRHGVPVIDTDRISHDLTMSGGKAMSQIEKVFGREYLNADGSLNRDLMRTTVFSHSASRKNLEDILHPLIRQEVERQLDRMAASYAIVVIPLLVEKGDYDDLVQRVLVVDCSRDKQIARTLARSKISREEVQAILSTQASRQQRLDRADDVIANDGRPAELQAVIQALNEKYSLMGHKKP
jgi:dephospho-CoA kinase